MTSQEERKLLNAEQVIIDELIKDLERIANQVQQLLTEIRDSKIDAATIKTELRFVVDSVKELSLIIRDGNGHRSLLTRLALVEKALVELKEYTTKNTTDSSLMNTKMVLLEQKLYGLSNYIDGLKAKEQEKERELTIALRERIAGKWKLYAAIISGTFMLLGSVLALLMSLLKQ